MQNDPSSAGGSPASQESANAAKADKEWSEFQRDLDTLGRQLAELGTHSAALGEHFLASLQARFQEVQSHAYSFKQAADEQLKQQADAAQGSFNEARLRSTEAAKDAARQVWERSEPLRQGAKDVGEGLSRAWGELRASLGKAAQRLQTEEKSANGTVPVRTEDRRDTP
jgi:hypothetical protein